MIRLAGGPRGPVRLVTDFVIGTVSDGRRPETGTLNLCVRLTTEFKVAPTGLDIGLSGSLTLDDPDSEPGGGLTIYAI